MADCIFCKIILGKIPCNKVYEDANTLAFLDAAPTSLGHTLVVSKNHYETFDEMKEIDVKSLAITAHKIAKAFKKISEGYNLIQNNKKVAGQIVPHVHFHIVPRKENDGIVWNRQYPKYSKEEMKEIADKIRGKIK